MHEWSSLISFCKPVPAARPIWKFMHCSHSIYYIIHRSARQRQITKRDETWKKWAKKKKITNKTSTLTSIVKLNVREKCARACVAFAAHSFAEGVWIKCDTNDIWRRVHIYIDRTNSHQSCRSMKQCAWSVCVCSRIKWTSSLNTNILCCVVLCILGEFIIKFFCYLFFSSLFYMTCRQNGRANERIAFLF